MMVRETWYVLTDESVADPREVRMGADGRLEHRDGRKVAYAPHGPRTRGVDPDVERAAAKVVAPGGEPDSEGAPTTTREMKPAKPRRQRYKTK